MLKSNTDDDVEYENKLLVPQRQSAILFAVISQHNRFQKIDVPQGQFLGFALNKILIDLVKLMNKSKMTILKNLKRNLPVVILNQIHKILLQGRHIDHIDTFLGAVEQSSIGC